MPKTMEILEEDVQDLVKGAEDLNSKIAAIKSITESGTETTVSGGSSAFQISEEMKGLQSSLDEFKTSLDAEFQKLCNKESYVNDLSATKAEILKLHSTFKELLDKNDELDEAVREDEDEKDDIEDEIAELEAKIAEEIEDMEKQDLEYEEKEKELVAEKQTIKEDLEAMKKLFEAEKANPQPNLFYESGDHSLSSSFVLT